MEGNLNIVEIKKTLEDLIVMRGRDSGGDMESSGIEYPMLLVSLGKDFTESDESIRYQLFRLLPAYEKHLLYYTYDTDRRVFIDGGNELSDEDLREAVTMLFQGDTYYRSYNQLMVYVLADETVINDSFKVSDCMDAIACIRESIRYQNQNINLIVQLDERIGHEEETREVKRQFGELLENSPLEGAPSVQEIYLISNKCTRGMINTPAHRSRIIADLIVLIDWGKDYLLSATKSAWIHTVGFNTVEKPVKPIVDTCVFEIVRHIGDLIKAASGSAEKSELALVDQLGINEDGSFDCFDPIIEDFMKHFPTDAQLELFPRVNSDPVGEIAKFTMAVFNDFTMGAWNAFIRRLVTNFEKQIREDGQINLSLKEQFSAYIRKRFPLFELITFSNHIPEVMNAFASAAKRINTDNDDLRKGVRRELSKNLLQNDKIAELFCEEAKRLGDSGKRLQSCWEKFQNELVKDTFFDPKDSSVKTFYSKRVQQYFNVNSNRIKEELCGISDVEELQAIIIRCCRELVDQDPAFSESFERELQTRLEAQDAWQAQSDIRDKLTGNNVNTWFIPTGTVMENPVLSVIMLRTDSDLHRFLMENLGENANYYDTDNGDSADVIQIFGLNKYHLL